MSTEFNPMEGLLADLLSTWDEEPSEVSSEVPGPAIALVAERGETKAESVSGYLPEPAPAFTPVRFVSALVKPMAREPIFLDELPPMVIPNEIGTSPEEPLILAAVLELPVLELPVLEVIASAPLAETHSAPETLVPAWREDPGAAAACAAILARMEREFAEREPVSVPARKNRLGSDAPRYVVFAVREMLFAVPIGRVLETDRMTSVTPLPGAAPGVKGLTNLRGEVVPVIDLRDVLGWVPSENPATRRMLVIQDGNRQPLTALLVDQVKGLAAFPATAWKSAEMAGAHGAEGFVEAVAERDREWVSRLNLDRVLNETHLPSLAAA